MQTTFLHAFRALKRGTVPHVERAWLIAIAQNVCRTMQRTSSRRRNLETNTDPELAADVSNAAQPLPDEIVGLDQALARIPANQRRALVLREWNGLRYHEIADVMGMSQSAVEMLAFRARRTLSESLNAERRGTRSRIRQALDASGILSAFRALLAGGGSGVHAIAGAGVAGLALATFGATPAPSPSHSHAALPRPTRSAVVTTTAQHPVVRRPSPRASESRSGFPHAAPRPIVPAVVPAPSPPSAPEPRSSEDSSPTGASAVTPTQPQAKPDAAPPEPAPALTVPAAPSLPVPAPAPVPVPAVPQLPTVDVPTLPVIPAVSLPPTPPLPQP